MNIERQRKNSDLLEELELPLKEIVRQLRMGVSDDLAYALMYQLRREIGLIVSELGAGAPLTQHSKKAKEIIEAQKWLSWEVNDEDAP